MRVGPLSRVFFYFLSAIPAASQIVPLILPAGTVLQIKIEKRIRIKGVGQQITGRLLQPAFVFNKEIIPAGSEVIGHIERLSLVNKQRRFKAILNGDFTPLRNPEIQFDLLKLPDGTTMPIKTGTASQWGVIAPYGKKVRARNKKNSFIGTTFERVRMELFNARQEIAIQINSQPKWDRLQDEAYSRCHITRNF
jgi:hypothetical protein